ncbi:MAG: hypothetical protein U9R56_02495 [candidate division Zixibacteria bacterium]|nr:hypothetical protein [candidate division Zixibacteria bacterium]
MDKTLYVVIACDTDPDRGYFVKDLPTDKLSWRGMLEGIPRAKDRLANLIDSEGCSPRFTWLLRVDDQIKRLMGAYNQVLKTNCDFLESLEQSGDELGWHPHFWRLDENNLRWYQECRDMDWQVGMLTKAHAAFSEVLPERTKTVRMGWTYHNNRTMAALDDLGVAVDVSGIPGLRIHPKKGKPVVSNFFDWSVTPSRPYYPSIVDYRREALETESSLSLLEAPNCVAKSIIWGMVSGLALARKMKDIRQIGYALFKPRFMSTITGKPMLFKPILAQVEKNLIDNDNFIYITPLHPDELIENIHPVYSLENMETNLKSLLEVADSLSAGVKYIKACEIKGVI